MINAKARKCKGNANKCLNIEKQVVKQCAYVPVVSLKGNGKNVCIQQQD